MMGKKETGYPDICTIYCQHFKTPDCPNSSECLAVDFKPHFEAKPCKSHWEAFKRKWERRKICKGHEICLTCEYKGVEQKLIPYAGGCMKMDVLYCRLRVKKEKEGKGRGENGDGGGEA